MPPSDCVPQHLPLPLTVPVPSGTYPSLVPLPPASPPYSSLTTLCPPAPVPSATWPSAWPSILPALPAAAYFVTALAQDMQHTVHLAPTWLCGTASSSSSGPRVRLLLPPLLRVWVGAGDCMYSMSQAKAGLEPEPQQDKL